MEKTKDCRNILVNLNIGDLSITYICKYLCYLTKKSIIDFFKGSRWFYFLLYMVQMSIAFLLCKCLSGQNTERLSLSWHKRKKAITPRSEIISGLSGCQNAAATAILSRETWRANHTHWFTVTLNTAHTTGQWLNTGTIPVNTVTVVQYRQWATGQYLDADFELLDNLSEQASCYWTLCQCRQWAFKQSLNV